KHQTPNANYQTTRLPTYLMHAGNRTREVPSVWNSLPLAHMRPKRLQLLPAPLRPRYEAGQLTNSLQNPHSIILTRPQVLRRRDCKIVEGVPVETAPLSPQIELRVGRLQLLLYTRWQRPSVLGDILEHR